MPRHQKYLVTQNGEKSERRGGPKTVAGKMIASRNSLWLGLHSRDLIVHTKWFNEAPAEFQKLLKSLLAEYPPRTPSQFRLVFDNADAEWRVARIVRIESLVYQCVGFCCETDGVARCVARLGAVARERSRVFGTPFTREEEAKLDELIKKIKSESQPLVEVIAAERPEQNLVEWADLLTVLERVHRREAHLRRVLQGLREQLREVFRKTASRCRRR